MATQVVDGEFTGKQIQQDQHSQRCRAWVLPAPGKGRGHSRGGRPPGPAHRCLGALGGTYAARGRRAPGAAVCWVSGGVRGVVSGSKQGRDLDRGWRDEWTDRGMDRSP